MDAGGVRRHAEIRHPFVHVHMHVDEAGAHDGVARVDLAPGRDALRRGAGRQHPSIEDRHVGDRVDPVSRIDHAAAAQNQIGAGEGGVHRGRLGHGRSSVQCGLLGHDPEKWKPVFGDDHAQTRS